MPEEASQQVTHADLDRAAEEAMNGESQEEAVVYEEMDEDDTVQLDTDNDSDETEEAVTETTEEPVEAVSEKPKERDTENAIRSWVGRQLKERDDALLERIEGLLKQNTQQAIGQEEEAEEEFITNKNLPNYLKKQIAQYEDEKKQQASKYQTDFTRAFANEGSSAENFDAIWNEFLDNHNEVVTGDPVADAKIGFYKAQAALVKKAKPEIPVKGKGAKLNTKTNVPDQIKGKEPKPVKLDPVAAEFVKKMKITDEFVQKTLGK